MTERAETEGNFAMVLDLISHLEHPCADPKNSEQNLLDFWLKRAKENLAILEEQGDITNAVMLRRAIMDKTSK